MASWSAVSQYIDVVYRMVGKRVLLHKSPGFDVYRWRVVIRRSRVQPASWLEVSSVFEVAR